MTPGELNQLESEILAESRTIVRRTMLIIQPSWPEPMGEGVTRIPTPPESLRDDLGKASHWVSGVILARVYAISSTSDRKRLAEQVFEATVIWSGDQIARRYQAKEQA